MRVCNRNKFNFTDLQDLFDPACFIALLEWLEVCFWVDSSVGDYQIDRLSLAATARKACFRDALATEVAINDKYVSWWVKNPTQDCEHGTTQEPPTR